MPAEPQGKHKNTGIGSLSLLQQIFLAQELNLGLLHCRWILYQLSHQGSPLCVVMKGFPGGASGKEPASRCRRHKSHGFDPWVGRCTGEENENPLQCSCLGNPTDRGAWWAVVHSIAKSWTKLGELACMHIVINTYTS